MATYRYISYDEIPANVSSFVCRVAGINNIHDLTITEINNFLVDLNEYYETQNQKMQDFIGT